MTRPSSLPEHLWAKTFGGMVLLLGLWLIPALLAALILHKAAREMAGPYLAFAAPGPVFLLVVIGLRSWEDRGAAPKRVALAWYLCTTLFLFTVVGATAYSAFELHFIAPENRDAMLIASGLSGAMGAVTNIFTVYRRTLTVATKRAAKRS